jgi:ubiquinone/menaquinone biosynthesis C-methylase UbiE
MADGASAENVEQKGLVIGVDLPAHLLDRVRWKAKRRGLLDVKFLLANMRSLDYLDGRLNAIVCFLGFLRTRHGMSGPQPVADGVAWRQVGLQRPVRML